MGDILSHAVRFGCCQQLENRYICQKQSTLMREKYLDPKADLTFKRIFGEHKDLVISLINALVPLPAGCEVASVEYLTPELVPDIPLARNSIVDVRCADKSGRQFLVEMQTVWTPAFMKRVLFNTSKAFVRQLDRSYEYNVLQPVYALCLVDGVFLPDLPDECIHNYSVSHERHADRRLDGIHMTFVELPKFHPSNSTEKRMAVLWLRFLTEINEDTSEAPVELEGDPLINKALGVVRMASFSKGELLAYDDFWDAVRSERTLISEATQIGSRRGYDEGVEKGMREGVEKGIREGVEKGMREGMEKGMERGDANARADIAKMMLNAGESVDKVMAYTGMDREAVEAIKNN